MKNPSDILMFIIGRLLHAGKFISTVFRNVINLKIVWLVCIGLCCSTAKVTAQCPPIGTLTCFIGGTVAIGGPGGIWDPSSCGVSTPAQEALYLFTPFATGMHTLVVVAANGNFGDYFFKEASGGCNNTGWTCIGRANSQATFQFGPLTAGINYFILFDAETTANLIHAFKIDCASVPIECIPEPVSPPDMAITCPGPTQTLEWPVVPGAISYKVFLGTINPPTSFVNTPLTSMSINMPGSTITIFWSVAPVYDLGIPAFDCPIWRFTHEDLLPPTITCPSSITVNTAPGVCNAVVNYNNPTATDNCAINPLVHLLTGLPSGSTFNLGLRVIAFEAIDNVNLKSNCAFSVTVKDMEPPTVFCPQSLTVQCAGDVPPVGIATAADNCGTPTILPMQTSTISNGCINKFTIVRQFRATDAAGNIATCEQTIVVNDNIAPVISINDPLLQGVPNGSTIEMQCFGSDPNWVPHTFSLNSVSAADNCPGIVNLTFNAELVDEGNCPVEGYINRYKNTWIATDVCGNSSSRFVFINLVDEIPPVLHGIPHNITVNCDEIPAPPPQEDISATDECLCACSITFSATTTAPGCQDGQVITRKWIATDACGNSTAGSQLITLIDKKGPIMHLNHPQLSGLQTETILEYTCNEGGIPEFIHDLNADDITSISSCGSNGIIKFNFTQDVPSNCEFFGYIEEQEFVWTGTDQCGNVSTFKLTAHVIDSEPPVLINVPDMVCAGDPSLDLVEAIDNCTDHGNVRYWDVRIPNPCGNGMATRRTYEGFDRCGNFVRDTTILLPADNNPPTLEFNVPELANLGPGEVLTVHCDARGNGWTNYDRNAVDASDDCTEGLNVTYEEHLLETSNCDGTGVLAVVELQWTATDHCGNEAILTALVNVVDQTPPVIQNAVAELNIGCHDALPKVHASDNCGKADVTIIDHVVPGSCEFQFDIERTIVASDPCGNTTTLTQLIRVGDNDGPRIDGVVAELCDDLSLPRVTAYDECANKEVTVQMTEQIVESECEKGTVMLRTWTATDLCGNTNQVTQSIVLNDNTPPNIMIPTHSIILVYLDQRPNEVVLSNTDFMQRLDDLDVNSVFVEDDCDQTIAPVFNLLVSYSANCALDGYYEERYYSWEARDACGNVNTIAFNVYVMDDVAPVISGLPSDATIVCADLPDVGIIHVEDYSPVVNQTFEEVINPTAIPGTFDVVRTWRVTDPCGNATKTSQHIKWIPDTQVSCDILLPTMPSCNTHGVVIYSDISGGLGEMTYLWKVEGVDCFIESGQGTPSISIYVGFNIVDIELDVIDAFGCSSHCSASLDCIDPFDPFMNISEYLPSDTQNEVAEVKSLRTNADENFDQISIWPNPARETIHLRFASTTNDEMQCTIMDLMGHEVVSQNFQVVKGQNKRQISMGQLATGSYLIRLQTKDKVHTQMVMVIHD